MKRVKGAIITYDQISQELAKIPKAELEESDDFVNDRHWQGGRYWIGWRPVPDDKGLFSLTAIKQWQYVCESFTQKNVIGSNIARLEGAILGNEPDFNIVAKNVKTEDNPVKELAREKTPDEKFYKEVDDQIVSWWTQNGVHQTFKDLLRSKASYGKTAILTYIPSGFLEEKEIEQVDPNTQAIVKKKVFGFPEDTLTMELVLSRIKVEVIHYKNVIDVKDTNFGTMFSVCNLETAEDVANGTKIQRYGVFYVDIDNRSYFRVVNSNNTEDTISCDLGGNNLCLTIGEYTKALVTPSVKKLQKAVNHAETGSNYALANINYPETTFINASPIEEKDAQGNLTGKKIAPKQGLGIYRWLNGLITETINGQQITTPEIHERNGADPEKFSNESEKKSRDIDMLMGMGYKHLADSEYASGDSKAKSMDDTDILISDYETSINTVGTKVLENVVRLAFFFTGQSQKNKDFNVLFRVNMSQGKLTNEDKKGMREECQQGLRSDESYMLIAKVSDTPKIEKARIAAQPPKEITDPKNNPKPANPGGGGNTK